MDTHYIPLPKRGLSSCEIDIPWHKLKGRVSLMLIEVQLIIIIISLFLVGYPDATRKALWEEGGQHGFNSDPKMRIYFYANYLQPPEIPFIWSRRCTEFNLAAGIFTLCLFLTRQLLALTASMSTRTEVYLLSCVLLFWIMSCIGQRSPDYSDPDHPSRVPWYLHHSCSIASRQARAACYVAQASYALTVDRLWYASWILILLLYAVLDYSIITRHWASKLFPSHSASQFCDEAERERGSSDSENLLMRAWNDL
ncbi:uncharacterized protein Bfra_000217 [Botrytis fragariae]|uniref:Uncharacterized protein n=1 Tax=Botrytis fragariae TaxID=1964551 RepID=A0A8H6B2N8_9HELO|nr:uncharacterized protein Bfra_000217 [Botrytis fragariae]KAF5878050.1 hypothetical protein Bfra_000217 [Botrytis fragariae]